MFKKGHKNHKLTLLHDIAPTLLELIGLEQPSHMDGISLLNNKINRESILLEYGKRKDDEVFTGSLKDVSEFKMIADIAPTTLAYDVNPYVGIRTHEYTMLKYYNQTHHEYELYNIKKDPFQLENLANKAEYVNLIFELARRLNKLEQCSGIECNTI
jgi:arylsulfatase A-like enzyme